MPGGSFAARTAGLFGESSFQLLIELGGAHGAGGLAQALDVIEGAPLGQKDVRDEIHVVEEDPFTLAAAFDGIGQDAEFPLEAEFDLVGDGDGLAVIGCRGNKEKVGKAGVDRIEFEDAGVFALFVLTGRGRGLNQNSGLLMLLGCFHSFRCVSGIHRNSGR